MVKRILAIFLLFAGTAIAADSYYQIPSPEGSGKKMRSINQTVGANDVYQQNILVSDPTSSYVATVNSDGSINTRLLSSATIIQTTTTPLNNGVTFTSQTFNTATDGHGFTVSAAADQNGHTYHDQSINGTDWISADDYVYTASAGHHEEHIAHMQYTRFRFVNDSGTNQTSFTFSVIQRHMDGFGTVKISPSDNLVSQDGIWENKITDGVDTLAVAADGSIGVTGTFFQATQPVSATNLDVRDLTSVSDSVECKQTTGTNLHTVVDSGSIGVTGTFWQATQPVSGSFYQATQPVSIASMPSTPVTGTFWQATQPVSGTFWQATQPVSGTVTVGTFPDNEPVNVALIAGTAPAAHDAPMSGDAVPLTLSGFAETPEDSDANTSANRASADADKTRILTNRYGVVYSDPCQGPFKWTYHENSSSALTDTTVHASCGSGLFNYVCSITFSTGGATAASVMVEDSTTAAILGPYYLEAVSGRGLHATFAGGKKQTTAATLISVTTTGAVAHGLDIQGYCAP